MPIVFSSITPGPGRWDEAPQRKSRPTGVIREYIATQPDLKFIDLWDAMLTSDGQPREDLWVEDRVHPNHAGYLMRVQLTRPLLGPHRSKTALNCQFRQSRPGWNLLYLRARLVIPRLFRPWACASS